ncbi:DUF2156 domain-containing protein [Frigidibacter albus]|uniref:DUF2156 domain-containing protein n=1 Tax=Frigidibacter albus TaxID=1465486 RepID=A0A6L8VCV2_9RHOB|nr:phosphatidylglycerol lysyltransferase domain-containing protein [Frigidibacter albus]MZQ88137.1 DUF2156 domain-containing protein [Frigidibacter albus]NBE30189.1 DUF2156 domain-containing protein [Frigidibacter albus]GGH47258.1 hypothetical protein GCM10011341_08280 [Frigidibacter albus]
MRDWGQAGHEGAAAYGALTPWRGAVRHLLPLALMVLFVLALREKAAALDLAAVGAALAGVSALQWLAAVAATAISFAALAQYDVLIHRQLGTALPEAQVRHAGAAAIALSQTLGFGIVTGALVRWRMLPGTSLGQATRIAAQVALAFLAGWAVVTAAAVAVLPVAVPGARGMALAVLAGFGALAALAFWQPQRFPPLPVAARIVALAALDTAAAALALWVLLPGGVEYGAALLPAFLLALGAGLISGTPGGVGAFELALLSLLPEQPAEPLLAAVLAWRAVYYALPAALGVLAMARPSRASTPRRLPQVRRAGPVPEAPRAETGLLMQGEHGLLLARDGTPGWLLSETGQTVTALLDPVAPEVLADMLAQVRAQAALRGRVACLYKISARTAAQARAVGWTVLPVAQEAVIDPAGFALAGPAHAGLRRKLRHVAKAGVTVTSVPPGGALPVAQMAALSAAWVTARDGERGFSMGRYTPGYVAGQHCLLAWQAGRLVAFVSFHTTRGEWALDLMRNGGGLPDGTMQALIAEAIAQAAEAGVPRLSLAAVPPDPARLRGLAARIWRLAARHPCGLAQFKAGFAPRWQTLYIAAPGPLSLALAAADIARAIRHPPPLPGTEYGFASASPAWQGSAMPCPERLPR